MKRSVRFLATTVVGLGTLSAASPAFAQYGSDGGSAGGAAAGLFILFCWGILLLVGLALWALNIWMFIDALQRQEWEFAGSTSKTTWLVLLGVGFFFSFGWIVALVYYFAVYKKVKRGTVAPPPGAYAPPGTPQGYAPQPPAPQGYAPQPPAPQGYAPPAPPQAPQGYAPPPPPPAPPAPSAPQPPAPETPVAPPAQPAPETPSEEPPAPPAPPTPGE